MGSGCFRGLPRGLFAFNPTIFGASGDDGSRSASVVGEVLMISLPSSSSSAASTLGATESSILSALSADLPQVGVDVDEFVDLALEGSDANDNEPRLDCAASNEDGLLEWAEVVPESEGSSTADLGGCKGHLPSRAMSSSEEMESCRQNRAALADPQWPVRMESVEFAILPV
ncbi:MAG: hypothetical protein M1835_007451 [Candelina submexicana]|nr:MAG: hypothetical protein M1835_007451 [Candelina submexicana]